MHHCSRSSPRALAFPTGAGVVRLKLTARGRKMLEHRRQAVLTIAAGKLRATVRLR